MPIKFKKDRRNKLWADFEFDIQNRSQKKDKNFILSGKWKKFFRKEHELEIYLVDGEWIRNNLSIMFGHGGHGFVCEFIPLNEIWISTHHFEECGCLNIQKSQKMSNVFIESTIVHEISELKEMQKGKKYWEAHQIALKQEKILGLLKDPYTEVDVN